MITIIVTLDIIMILDTSDHYVRNKQLIIIMTYAVNIIIILIMHTLKMWLFLSVLLKNITVMISSQSFWNGPQNEVIQCTA